MENRRPKVSLESASSEINTSVLRLRELKPGQYYWCVLSKRRVLYNEIKIFGLFVYRYVVWYDKETDSYKRAKVEANQLRNIANTDIV